MLLKKYDEHDNVQDKQMLLKGVTLWHGMLCYAILCYGMVWKDFKMHVTVSNCYFSRTSTFINTLKFVFFIKVELMFLYDVTISNAM